VVAGLAAGQAFHEPADAGGFLRRQQQVHVVGHQAEGVDLDAVLLFELPQRRHIPLEVGWLGEGHLAVVAALDDVMRIMR